jgi:natural product precursor
MRKVKIKKLMLSKETLRDLEKSELRRALGGNTVQLCTEGTGRLLPLPDLLGPERETAAVGARL